VYIEGLRMSEAHTSGTKPKKMVNRKVVSALGLACIVLIALVTYLTVTNANLANQIANQNDTISQLESNITDLQDQIAIENATIASLEASLISTVKMASVTKEESLVSTLHVFSFTIQVKNNGTNTVNDITVEIGLYHDWMNVIYAMNGTEPVTIYTNEIQDYILWGNILHFGTIPAGENEIQITHIGIGDILESGYPVPVNYAVATLLVGNIPIDEQTLQINENLAEQTWVFP
jgi:cell division protein FtsB